MFSEEEHWTIFTLLAAILHLGNIRFQGKVCSLFTADTFHLKDFLLYYAFFVIQVFSSRSETATIHYALKTHTGHVKTLCDDMS